MRPTSDEPRLKAGSGVLHPDKPKAGKRPNNNYQWARHAYPLPNESRRPEPSWVASQNCCKCLPVLSERRRRFPQVLPDDEGGLRRETHRTAIGGETGEYRQAVVEG